MSDDISKKKLSIYLLKEDFSDSPSDFLKESSSLNKLDIKNSDDDKVGTLYFTKSRSKTPEWVKFISDGIDEKEELDDLHNSHTKAVLIVETNERKFAITFGYGRYLLEDSVEVNRFGLIVTLNSIDEDSIRSIDKIKMSSVPLHIHGQLSKTGSSEEFDINERKDLIRSITGKSNEEDNSRVYYGKDSLKVSLRVDLDNLKTALEDLYEKYKDESYKEKFPKFGKIEEVDDKKRLKELNDRVIEKIKEGSDDTWLAVPELVHWSKIKGFKYGKSKKRKIFDDLSLNDLFDEISKDREDVDLGYLTSKYIWKVIEEGEEEFRVWKVFDCLYSEVNKNNDLYMLTNGNWYKIKGSFKDEINDYFNEIPRSDLDVVEYDTEKFKGRGEDKGERGYNKQLANEIDGWHLMDRKNIPVEGRSKVEYCDLLSEDNKLIHVKRYGGSSALSHLFNQGLVSSELLLSSNEFRENLNEELPSDLKFSNPNNAPNPEDYTVIFAIIKKDDSAEFDLPFFSKVTLKDTIIKLKDMRRMDVKIQPIKKID